MSTHPDPPEPNIPHTPQATPTPQTPSFGASADLFDTPLFNRLIKLIEDQNATSERQNLMLEEQREVMKDMRRALNVQQETMAALLTNKSQAAADISKLRAPQEGTSDTGSVMSHSQATVAPVREVQPHPGSQEPSLEKPAVDLADNGTTAKIFQQEGTLGLQDDPTEIHEIGGIGTVDGEAPVETPSKDSVSETIMTLRDILQSVKDTLVDHGKKFDLLIRDAIKDDQPYDLKPMEDESTCTALFEIAMARTKEEVDEWIKRMDVSLVFIALFSAVLTAFVVPATQNLFPSSNNSPGNPTDSPPPVPKTSAQDVFILYSLALIVAILNAVLSVLGRQWMSKLTTRPLGNTYKERLLRHIAREDLAKRWLGYLVEGLHILLLWSIGLFMTGLLYQILNLSGSFEKSTPRIFAAWIVGVVLSSGILVVVLGATTHALLYEASPFGGPFSRLLYQGVRSMSLCFDGLMTLLSARMNNSYHLSFVFDEARGIRLHVRDRFRVFESFHALRGEFKEIPLRMRMLLYAVQVISSPLWVCGMLIRRWRVGLNLSDEQKLIGAFMELIAEASDPKLLERAMGSFSYIQWFENGRRLADPVEKAASRSNAADTSVRVQETLKDRFRHFVTYTRENWKTVGPRLTKGLMLSFLEFQFYPQEFREEFLTMSLWENNADLRGLSALPFEECIAEVLCSYTHKGNLGDRWRIFDLAQKHCSYLLREGKRDDVTRILSHVDHLDLIKSFIQYPDIIDSYVVESVVKDRKHEILRAINEFVKSVDQTRLGPYSLSRVFSVLASPPPTDIDLSPLIDYISRHPDYGTWKETSDTIIAYLNSFGVSQVSDSTAVRRFLEQCVDYEFCDKYGYQCPMNNVTRSRAGELLAELNSFSSPPTGAIASTSFQPASSSHYPSQTPIPSDSSQPDPLLTPSADNPSAALEDINSDPATFPNPESDIPMLTLTHPSPMIASSESELNSPLPSNSQAVFAQSPALENANGED
ncbi:hypothetical protein SISNIDRAFT_528177 [Sistotremastrum niveocremeum HHB9708]|uniref:DUF6535 domain-containing protein n=1 Tax=Sistotremastrum niveocremeum HHB9708 TaxID=1314777 RepID=A0A164PQQ0_9AGAM|nr:hypothetical protein SISNIDRAFT_528177 [Sistotremastrum niveocremeum HHB9708]